MAQPIFSLPQSVETLLEQLHAAGHTAEVVGGCVRSLLLGAPVHDWDICTSALPTQVQACFARERVLETGLQHGTVMLVRGGTGYEITTYRTEGAYTDHRRPDSVAYTTCLERDLARRDFTVNAMAYSPRRGLVDLFAGQQDLQRGMLRCVGSAVHRFEEDALRVLRALRFAAQLGFTLVPETQTALRACAPQLEWIAAERKFAELTKLLRGRGAGEVLAEYGSVSAQVLPCLAPMLGFAQANPYHDKDVWLHTAAAVGAAAQRAQGAGDEAVAWALLLHDAGKPNCFTRDAAGCGHFYAHAAHSERHAREALALLRAPGALRTEVCRLVQWHDLPLEATRACAARRLHRLGAPTLERLLEVKRCDTLAQAPAHRAQRLAALDAFEDCVRQVLDEACALRVEQLPVRGEDVLALGVPAGPAVGALLRGALAQVLDGALPCTREALLGWLAAQGNRQKNRCGIVKNGK